MSNLHVVDYKRLGPHAVVKTSAYYSAGIDVAHDVNKNRRRDGSGNGEATAGRCLEVN